MNVDSTKTSFDELSDDTLLKQYNESNEAFNEHYPCDDQCHSWMDELSAMSRELARRGVEHERF